MQNDLTWETQNAHQLVNSETIHVQKNRNNVYALSERNEKE